MASEDEEYVFNDEYHILDNGISCRIEELQEDDIIHEKLSIVHENYLVNIFLMRLLM